MPVRELRPLEEGVQQVRLWEGGVRRQERRLYREPRSCAKAGITRGFAGGMVNGGDGLDPSYRPTQRWDIHVMVYIWISASPSAAQGVLPNL